jgi:hypothetical protein
MPKTSAQTWGNKGNPDTLYFRLTGKQFSIVKFMTGTIGLNAYVAMSAKSPLMPYVKFSVNKASL